VLLTLEELSVVYTADVQPALDAIRSLMLTLSETAGELSHMEGAFTQAGSDAALGLARGILSSREQVLSAARELASVAADALRSALQIHSPSRVTEEMGAHFTSGLANGILGSAAALSEAPAFAPQSAAFFASSPAFENVTPAQENIHITVPIEVDGYQLGVAAIEGINRVSRATGRAELSV